METKILAKAPNSEFFFYENYLLINFLRFFVGQHQRFRTIKTLFYSQFIFLFLLSFTLRAAPPEPSDLFLKAYQEFQNAERLERQNIPDKALDRYRYTASILHQLQKNNSDWQPLIVNYRLQKTQANIARLEAFPPSLFNNTNTQSSGSLGNSTIPSVPNLSITPPSENSSFPISDLQPISTPQYEMRKLRSQLEQATLENRRLNAVIAKAEAEKQSALIEIDRIRVSLIEVKSQNANIQSKVNIVNEQQKRMAQLQEVYKTQLSSLQGQIDTFEADNSVLSEENERLLNKLKTASNYIQDSDKIREGLLKDRQRLSKEGYAAKEQLKKIKDNSQLVEELKKTNETFLDKISELSKKFTESQVATQKATERAENAETQVNKLSTENTALSTQLTQNKEYIEKLQKEYPNTEALIAELQSKFNLANQELANLLETVNQGNKRIFDLETQLKNTSDTFEQFKLSKNEDLRLKEEETTLLRNIILRAMEQQTQRNQALKFIDDELESLNLNSAPLSEQLAILDQPLFKLNDKEKNLLPSPLSSTLATTNPSVLNASVTIVKKNSAPIPPILNTQSTSLVSPVDILTSEQKSLAQLAEIAFEQGKFEDSEALYNRIIEKNPENVSMLANLGAVQSQLGKYLDAESALNKALALNPSHAFATTALGILQLKRNEISNAIETLKNSVKLDSQNFSAHNYLGIAYGEMGQLEAAERELKKAIQLNPNYASAHFNLAVLYSTEKLLNKELARKHYLLSKHLGATPDIALERLIQ